MRGVGKLENGAATVSNGAYGVVVNDTIGNGTLVKQLPDL